MAWPKGARLGDYEIIALLGSGAAGEVYQVRHRLTGRVEALKILHPGRAYSPEEEERFLREIRLQASLQHPNIAAVYNAFRVSERLAMAMEYVEGRNLREILKSGPLKLDTVLEIAHQALDGLAYAHEQGMIHRDIKPENILVTKDGTVKLTDFGLAKTLVGAHGQSTRTTAVLGSLWYVSPEQVLARSDIGPQSDLYSLGAVIYEMVTGQPPFTAQSDFELMKAHVEHMPEPPSQYVEDLPPMLNDLVLAALRKNPEQRIQSAGEFRRMLEKVPRRAAKVRVEASAPAVTRRRLRKQVWTAIAATLAGILTTATVSLSRWPGVKAPPVPPPPLVRIDVPPPDFAYEKTPPPPEPEKPPRPRARRRPKRKAMASVKPKPAEEAAPTKEPSDSVLAVATPQPPPQPPVEPPAPPPPLVPALIEERTLSAPPDGKHLVLDRSGRRVAVFGGPLVHVFQVSEPGAVIELGAANAPVTAVALAATGKWLVSGDFAGAIRIWNLPERREVATIALTSPVTALDLDPAGKTLVAAFRDRSIRMWRREPSGFRLLRAKWRTPRKPAVSIAYEPRSGHVVAATPGQLLVWGTRRNKPLRMLFPAGNNGTVEIRAQGGLLAAAGDKGCWLWFLPARLPVGAVETKATFHDLACPPTGRCVAAAAAGRTVSVWEPLSGAQIALQAVPAEVIAVAISEDAHRVAALDARGGITVWRLNQPALAAVLEKVEPEEIRKRVAVARAQASKQKKRGLFRRLLGAFR